MPTTRYQIMQITMKKKYTYTTKLVRKLEAYAISRSLEFDQYSPWHMRLMDGGYVTVDVWTTRKYYVKQTDYHKLTKQLIVERAGEKGMVPKLNLYKFLDKLFFAADMLEETDEP